MTQESIQRRNRARWAGAAQLGAAPASGRCRLPYDARVDPPDLGLSPGAAMARDIPARSYRRTMPGWMPSSKSAAGTLRAESILEIDGLALFEADARFVQLATQPHELQYLAAGDFGQRRARYYPDLIARHIDGRVIVVDFKTDADAGSTRWREKSAIVGSIYEALNVRFETLCESVVRREPRRSNVKLLLRHRPSGAPLDVEAEAEIWRVVNAGPAHKAQLGDIVGWAGLDLHSCADSPLFTTFAQLVLGGHLKIDLNSPISVETIVGPGTAAAYTNGGYSR